MTCHLDWKLLLGDASGGYSLPDNESSDDKISDGTMAPVEDRQKEPETVETVVKTVVVPETVETVVETVVVPETVETVVVPKAVESPEVEIVGVRFKELEDVTTIHDFDIFTILANSTRPFALRTWFLNMDDLPTARPLRPGSAYLLTWKTEEYVHTVALWRGTDGQYFYFDSVGFPFPHQLQTYCFFHGCHNLQMLNQPIQGPEMGTCTYHALSFLDFVTRRAYIPTKELRDLYPPCRLHDSDVQAVRNVEEILSEFPNSIRTRRKRFWGKDAYLTLVQEALSEDTVAARVKRRRKRKRKDKDNPVVVKEEPQDKYART